MNIRLIKLRLLLKRNGIERANFLKKIKSSQCLENIATGIHIQSLLSRIC